MGGQRGKPEMGFETCLVHGTRYSNRPIPRPLDSSVRVGFCLSKCSADVLG